MFACLLAGDEPSRCAEKAFVVLRLCASVSMDEMTVVSDGF